jgi:sugar transferase (PEP-CTERM/EpsH1 system associated)
VNLLYLVHRLPYPPNKGDKVRSFHLMKHLARKHRLYLGTFIDDADDAQWLDAVRGYCAEAHIARLHPRRARLRSLSGLWRGEALSLPYYRDAGLQAWVKQIRATQPIDAAIVFSSVMAQYLPDLERLPTLIDFVDMDSAKWRQYATTHRWPMSWLYRREGERLFAFERDLARRARHGFFVTRAECELFLTAAPECAGKIDAMGNGVDAEYFTPLQRYATPYRPTEIPLVFTGAMDYWPNVDAALWFAKDILPAVRERHSAARFYIVGRSPDPAIQALAGESVVVTGTVPDVRPYLAHAAVVVAPLRIARGIQNKVLEAMAMARPVIASRACARPIEAKAGEELLIAESAADYVMHIDALLKSPAHADNIGAAARQRVLASYSWDAHLALIDHHLASLAS